ncbi:hypothetical protein OQA88_10901 [Cercophora sp. LCS_1]
MLLCDLFIAISVVARNVAAVPVDHVASHAALNNSLEGYEIVDYTWSLCPYFDHRDCRRFQGTIQQGVAAMNKINPDYGAELIARSNSSMLFQPLNNSTNVPLNSSMTIPGDYNPKSHKCGAPYTACYYQRIFQGVMYLLGLDKDHDKPHLEKKTCSRVSCSYKSAIWLCNDVSETEWKRASLTQVDLQHSEPYDIERWHWVGMAAYWIDEACKDERGIWTSGRRDFFEKWHVQVQWDETNGC